MLKTKTKRKVQRLLLRVRPSILKEETRFLNNVETVDYVLKNNVSLSRLGDGEFSLINNKSITFQEANSELSERLLGILNTPKENILVCVPSFINISSSKWKRAMPWKVKNEPLDFWTSHLYNYGTVYKNSLKNVNLVGDTQLSRFYMDYIHNDLSVVDEYVNKLKLLWQDKDIVFVEGKYSRLGVDNDFFDTAKSIKRIICPNKNAFSKYDDIMKSVATMVNKDSLIILALGPTATVLSYDLALLGYQALDIGHVDIEYEWYKKGATQKINIENKDVNEASSGDGYVTNDTLDDKEYQSQIIDQIE